MTHHRSNQDPRKSKSKEGSRRQSDRSQTASSSQRENRSGSSSGRTSTSQPNGSSSSSGRRHSSHGSAQASQIDFDSLNAEQGSLVYDGYGYDHPRVNPTQDTVDYSAEARQQRAERHPRVTFPHHRPRHSDHSAEIGHVDDVFATQGYQTQGPAPTYPRDLEFDSDDASYQDNPQNYGGYGGYGGGWQ